MPTSSNISLFGFALLSVAVHLNLLFLLDKYLTKPSNTIELDHQHITLTLLPDETPTQNIIIKAKKIKGIAAPNKPAIGSSNQKASTSNTLNIKQISKQFFNQSDHKNWIQKLDKTLKQKIRQGKQNPLFSQLSVKHYNPEAQLTSMAKHCFASPSCKQALDGLSFAEIDALFPFFQHPDTIGLERDRIEKNLLEHAEQTTKGKR